MNLKEFPAIIIIPADEVNSEEPIERYDAVLNITLECWVKNRDEITVEVNQLLADVQKALLVDYTRDGKAMDTNLRGNSPFYNDVNEPYGGVDIRIAIHYRTKYADPYVLG